MREAIALLVGLALIGLGVWLSLDHVGVNTVAVAGSSGYTGDSGYKFVQGGDNLVVVEASSEDKLYSGGVIWLEKDGKRYNATWLGSEAVFHVEPGVYVLAPYCCRRFNAVRAPGRYKAFYGGGCWFLSTQG